MLKAGGPLVGACEVSCRVRMRAIRPCRWAWASPQGRTSARESGRGRQVGPPSLPCTERNGPPAEFGERVPWAPAVLRAPIHRTGSFRHCHIWVTADLAPVLADRRVGCLPDGAGSLSRVHDRPHCETPATSTEDELETSFRRRSFDKSSTILRNYENLDS